MVGVRVICRWKVVLVLMLFPAKEKNAIPYGGHMGVADVIKFIADHGSNSHHLIHEKGNCLCIGYIEIMQMVKVSLFMLRNFDVLDK